MVLGRLVVFQNILQDILHKLFDLSYVFVRHVSNLYLRDVNSFNCFPVLGDFLCLMNHLNWFKGIIKTLIGVRRYWELRFSILIVRLRMF